MAGNLNEFRIWVPLAWYYCSVKALLDRIFYISRQQISLCKKFFRLLWSCHNHPEGTGRKVGNIETEYCCRWQIKCSKCGLRLVSKIVLGMSAKISDWEQRSGTKGLHIFPLEDLSNMFIGSECLICLASPYHNFTFLNDASV
jgi:hypothetical protein